MSGAPFSDDDDLLAAELALGVLSPAEAAAGEARMASDAAFSARVAWWQDRLAQLGDGLDGAEPSQALWPRIVSALPPQPTSTSVAVAGAPFAAPSAANDNFLARLARQPAAALLAVGLVIAGIGAWSWRPHAPPPPIAAAPPAPLLASLTGTNGASAAVFYQPGDGRLRIVPAGVAAKGHAAELWVIPADGRPRSLGVVDAGAPSLQVIAADRRGLIAPGATLAISIEPVGGSPTGLPTGPVVSSGKIFAG